MLRAASAEVMRLVCSIELVCLLAAGHELTHVDLAECETRAYLIQQDVGAAEVALHNAVARGDRLRWIVVIEEFFIPLLPFLELEEVRRPYVLFGLCLRGFREEEGLLLYLAQTAAFK